MNLHSPYRRLSSEEPLTAHHGVFRREISFAEGVALIVSGTIGAGIFSIPFVVAEVGVLLGFAEIMFIGLLMLGINLLLGEMAFRSNMRLQLAGLAGRYLGAPGKWLMSVLSYTLLLGALLIYIIGEGETLSALFGGTPFMWSTIFFLIGSFFIFLGLRTIKVMELVLSMGLLCIMFFLVLWSAPHIQFEHWRYADLAQFFIPYGVLVFAYHGTTSVPEAYSVLPKDIRLFRKVIVTAGSIVMAVYAIFALVVVGVTGPETTEIATIGLGEFLGPAIFLVGNVFASLAMGTSFLMAGVVLRDSLAWDFHVRPTLAALLVVGVPFLVFLLGIREFIATIDVIGGVFMSLEILLILFMYLRLRRSSTGRT